jgi:hypothetical protein
LIGTWLSARRCILLLAALPLLLVLASTAGATVQWTSGERISGANVTALDPDVAVLPSGQAIAVWSQNDGTNDRIRAAIRNSAGVFGAPQTISNSGQNAFEPRVATDPAGNAVAVWTRPDGTNQRVEAAYRPAGGSFGTVQILSPAGANGFEPEVSMDATGTATAVWTHINVSLQTERIQTAQRPPGSGSSFGTVETLSVADRASEHPEVASEAGGNAVAAWTMLEPVPPPGTGIRPVVQSSSRLEVPGYVRPAAAANFRVPLVIAFQGCHAPDRPPNRQHSGALSEGSCNPALQEVAPPPATHVGSLTVGTFDANGFAPRFGGSVKFTVCLNGTTVTGACSTPSGMTVPDVRIESNSSDIRCRITNAACPGGFGSDYTGKVALRVGLRITDRYNGTLNNDPGTTDLESFKVPIQCVSTADTTVGSDCDILTSANTVFPGSVPGGKRSNWAVAQVQLRDAGPNGTGYNNCPPGCGDGDEVTFAGQGIFVP